jgi:hypothetical protein
VAKALGLSRTALYRRLERHGLGAACARMSCRMTLRRRLGAYLVALHLLLFGCASPAAVPRQVRRCCSSALELLLAASLALGWRLVRRALEPLGYTRRFHDLLQDQHYAAAWQRGDAELDDLVGMFNTMLAPCTASAWRSASSRASSTACWKRRRARCWCSTSTAPSAW